MTIPHVIFEAIVGVVFVAFFIVAAVLGVLSQRDKSDPRPLQMLALARKLGFADFDPRPNKEFPMGWGFLNQFSKGENRYVFNLLDGIYQDQKLFVFDYHYQIDTGREEKLDRVSTMLMLIEKECFPQMTISGKNALARIQEAFDGDSIQFESAEFSRAFHVRCADKKFAYDVCNPQMMEFLLANRDLQIEIQGPVILLVFEPQLSVKLIEFNLQRLAQIRSLLPQYIFTNQ
jgi:hypothetical protein